MFATNDADTLFKFGGYSSNPGKIETEFFNAYSYNYIELPARVTWTIGGSVNRYEESRLGIGKSDSGVKFFPKAGVRADLTDFLSIRASYLMSRSQTSSRNR